MSESIEEYYVQDDLSFAVATIIGSFQKDLSEARDSYETDSNKPISLSAADSDQEFANELKSIDDELSAGVPEIETAPLKELKSKKRNSYLNELIEMVSRKHNLIYDKSVILTIIWEVVLLVIRYKKLQCLFNIDSIAKIYSEKLADTVLSEKYLSGDEYTIENIIDMVRKFAYLRAISWKKQLIEQDKNSSLVASDFIFVRDEERRILDYGHSDKQGLNSIRDLFNAYRYSQEDIGLFNAIVEKTLRNMARKHSKNSRLHTEIMASEVGKIDLLEGEVTFHRIAKEELLQLRHQAYKSFYIMSIGYYPKKHTHPQKQMKSNTIQSSINHDENILDNAA